MKIRQIVGDNIRGYRHAKGWSQEKLGVRAKLHYNYIGTIERGEKTISVDSLASIAKALNVPIVQFFIDGSYRKK
jgi:transcriptional regulator with XRE-family HTH domain